MEVDVHDRLTVNLALTSHRTLNFSDWLDPEWVDRSMTVLSLMLKPFWVLACSIFGFFKLN